jgi:8-oxo-(d)GTP phosphatase
VPRRAGPEGVEVLLVHRPKYDDWSFPKGKLDPGEHLTTAAVRETREESGLVVGLDAPLGVQRYSVSGRPKRVHYWASTVLSGRFRPNSEVDRVAWLTVDRARERLSWKRDTVLLDTLAALGAATAPVVLLEPGSSLAGGEPGTRPLDTLGHAQARALLPLVTAYAPQRLVCSDEVDALETATPLADATGLVVEVNPLLSASGWQEAGDPARRQLLAHLLQPIRTLVCGSAVPALEAALAGDGRPEPPCGAGAALRVLHVRPEGVVASEGHGVDEVAPQL